MENILIHKLDELKDLCRLLKIKRMYVFGSIVTGKFNENSDIDFLISFQDNISIDEYTANFFTLHYTVQAMFNREIDIVTERSLSNPYLISRINESKELIYEAGN